MSEYMSERRKRKRNIIEDDTSERGVKNDENGDED